MRCPGCFEEKDEEQACSVCGYENEQYRSSLLLPYGTILREQYVIGNVLGAPGGFGVTYLGYNNKLETKVAIKEYLPREFTGREADSLMLEVHSPEAEVGFQSGLEQFLKEAQLLAKYRHPSIVRVIDFFEENKTAYLVMDYYQGINLVEYVRWHGGALKEADIRKIMYPILDGLREVHARGMLHRDIKPENIYITNDGLPILLDFGAARQMCGDEKKSLSVVMTPGFAPYEQYYRQGKQGPWTDVYGCSATIYYMLTGMTPIDVLGRLEKDTLVLPDFLAASISPELRYALTKGLAVLPENRIQSISELQGCLANETLKLAKSQLAVTMVLPEGLPLAPEETCSTQGNLGSKVFFKRWTRIIIAALVILAILGGSYKYYEYTHDPVHRLTESGLEFTEEGYFSAIKRADQEAVRLYLKAGMSVNERNNSTGELPIMVAVEANQPTMVTFLMNNGAALLAKDQQGSLVDLAIKKGSTQVLKQLMDQLNLTPNTPEEQGTTLFEKAIEAGNIVTVKYLIEQGADINREDDKGNTILDKVLAGGNQQMAMVLKNAGAKESIKEPTIIYLDLRSTDKNNVVSSGNINLKIGQKLIIKDAKGMDLPKCITSGGILEGPNISKTEITYVATKVGSGTVRITTIDFFGGATQYISYNVIS